MMDSMSPQLVQFPSNGAGGPRTPNEFSTSVLSANSDNLRMRGECPQVVPLLPQSAAAADSCVTVSMEDTAPNLIPISDQNESQQQVRMTQPMEEKGVVMNTSDEMTIVKTELENVIPTSPTRIKSESTSLQKEESPFRQFVSEPRSESILPPAATQQNNDQPMETDSLPSANVTLDAQPSISTATASLHVNDSDDDSDEDGDEDATDNSKNPSLPSPASAALNGTHTTSSRGKQKNVRVSCHQCKTTKDDAVLLFCTTKAEKGKRKRKCRKKYCDACLRRSYNMSIAALTPYEISTYCCPACTHTCSCAACQRKHLESTVRKEQLARTAATATAIAATVTPATVTATPATTAGPFLTSAPLVRAAIAAASSTSAAANTATPANVSSFINMCNFLSNLTAANASATSGTSSSSTSSSTIDSIAGSIVTSAVPTQPPTTAAIQAHMTAVMTAHQKQTTSVTGESPSMASPLTNLSNNSATPISSASSTSGFSPASQSTSSPFSVSSAVSVTHNLSNLTTNSSPQSAITDPLSTSSSVSMKQEDSSMGVNAPTHPSSHSTSTIPSTTSTDAAAAAATQAEIEEKTRQLQDLLARRMSQDPNFLANLGPNDPLAIIRTIVAATSSMTLNSNTTSSTNGATVPASAASSQPMEDEDMVKARPAAESTQQPTTNPSATQPVQDTPPEPEAWEEQHHAAILAAQAQSRRMKWEKQMNQIDNPDAPIHAALSTPLKTRGSRGGRRGGGVNSEPRVARPRAPRVPGSQPATVRVYKRKTPLVSPYQRLQGEEAIANREQRMSPSTIMMMYDTPTTVSAPASLRSSPALKVRSVVAATRMKEVTSVDDEEMLEETDMSNSLHHYQPPVPSSSHHHPSPAAHPSQILLPGSIRTSKGIMTPNDPNYHLWIQKRTQQQQAAIAAAAVAQHQASLEEEDERFQYTANYNDKLFHAQNQLMTQTKQQQQRMYQQPQQRHPQMKQYQKREDYEQYDEHSSMDPHQSNHSDEWSLFNSSTSPRPPTHHSKSLMSPPPMIHHHGGYSPGGGVLFSSSSSSHYHQRQHSGQQQQQQQQQRSHHQRVPSNPHQTQMRPSFQQQQPGQPHYPSQSHQPNYRPSTNVNYHAPSMGHSQKQSVSNMNQSRSNPSQIHMTLQLPQLNIGLHRHSQYAPHQQHAPHQLSHSSHLDQPNYMLSSPDPASSDVNSTTSQSMCSPLPSSSNPGFTPSSNTMPVSRESSAVTSGFNLPLGSPVVNSNNSFGFTPVAPTTPSMFMNFNLLTPIPGASNAPSNHYSQQQSTQPPSQPPSTGSTTQFDWSQVQVPSSTSTTTSCGSGSSSTGSSSSYFTPLPSNSPTSSIFPSSHGTHSFLRPIAINSTSPNPLFFTNPFSPQVNSQLSSSMMQSSPTPLSTIPISPLANQLETIPNNSS